MRGVLAFLLAFVLVPWGGASAAAADPVFVKVISGLSQPVDIQFGPDGSLYYIELMDGGLRRIAPGATTPDAAPLWTASSLQTGGERGLMGLALDPDFATTHAFYMFFTFNGSGTPVDRLVRVVDGQETVLLDDIRTEIMHNSGRILFMPDGTLLVSVGDATLDTIGRDASKHAHDPAVVNGKVLRLNKDGSAAAGNAWGNMVWTKGHRNVYGLARNEDGSVVLGTENGPDRGDEVNVLVGGKDYGWPTCAGVCTEDPACGACDHSAYTDPVISYTPTVAPTGIAYHAGSFYFADFNQGRLHRAHLEDNGTWSDTIVGRIGTRVLDVTVGADGLYLSTWDSVYRVGFADASGGESTAPPTLPSPSVSPSPSVVSSPSPHETMSPGAQENTGSTEQHSGNAVPTVGLGVALAFVATLAILRRRRG